MTYILLVLQQIIASSTHIVAKLVEDHVDPALLVVLRASVASIAALLWIRMRKKKRVLHRKDYARLFLLGLISVPGNQFGYLYGLHRTTPANAALLYAMTPALVVLAQKFILREQISARRMIAVAVAFIGAVIILVESDINFGGSISSATPSFFWLL
jgi:drug/metabolite transporter (DMT)-like permease